MTVAARVVQRNQLSIDAAITRHIFPLVIESDPLIVSLNDVGGAARSYTFSPQLNDVAFAGIVPNCRGRRPMNVGRPGSIVIVVIVGGA